ncbi:hypothetical protein [Streptacidiphilus cavernicola]|uniref:Integral membrane protein n=1 Tax=Streptacidiphilus cavernicola TaxID=3342716 RepID=A0ABV6VTL0_9ACTN
MRGTYALARVVVIRGTVARTLLWIGAVGAVAGLAVPSLTGRRHGALVGLAAFVVFALVGLLQRYRWYTARANTLERAPFAVTTEPPIETRHRLARGNSLWLLVGMSTTAALGLLGGPAAGMLVLGYGVGLFCATQLLARWERGHETLVWARTEDGRLLGRRSRIAPFSATGPAAGQVRRPVVKGAGRAR